MSDDLGKIENNLMIIYHKMTRQDMANMAGTSRETLTRIMLEFQDEGIIASGKNEIVIHDAKRLNDKIL